MIRYRFNKSRLGMTLVALTLVMASTATAQNFTKAQAGEGRTAYRTYCASCHGAKLEGMHLSPSLVGPRFDMMWRGKTAEALSFHIRRMPPDPDENSGKLGAETYTNILAYILMSNGFEASDKALSATLPDQARIKIPLLPGTKLDIDAPVVASAEQKQLLANLSPVSNAMLEQPAGKDWLQWGGSYTATSYSTLDKINTSTVKSLAPVWHTPIRPGTSMSVPLVHDGVMFVHSFPDTVLALDATNGQILWRYQHQGSPRATTKAGIALHGDKVFVPTSDQHMVALNAKTGEVIWDHALEVKAPKGGRGDYSFRSAPMVIGKTVIQGVTASFVPRGGFLFAMDIETGKELWHFNTIARPGEPGGETWNDVPMDRRSGGSVWHQYTYDPEYNLIYLGVAPTYDTGPLVTPVEKEGVSSEALFTNCTVALDADTGELVWHYQHMQNDQWDLDWAFERQIVTLDVNGKDRKVVMNVGKMAMLDALDAATGEYLFSVDSETQNVIIAVDEETGAKTIDMGKWPDPERDCDVCPNAAGARSWPPTAYSPETNLVYVPIMEWCMRLGKSGMQLLTSGVGITTIDHPDAADGTLGRLQALDVKNHTRGWEHNQLSPITTGMLATAGGVLFSGDMDPSLRAFDAATGEQLWRAELDAFPSSSIITYRVGEQQFVAVLAGISNLHIDFIKVHYRAVLGKDYKEPVGSPSIWVFAL